MNYEDKIQASISCAHTHLDIDTGYFCPQHRGERRGDGHFFKEKTLIKKILL